MRALLALVLMCAGLCPGAQAEDEPAGSPDVRARVQQWLEDLRSEEYPVRDAARAGLEREGLQARDLLEARKDDPDLEVRATIRALLARPAPNTDVRQDPAAAATDIGRVSGVVPAGTFLDRLEAFGVPFGAVFEWPALTSPDKSLPPTAVRGPWFEVLQLLLAEGGLMLSDPFTADGIAKPRAAAGRTAVPQATVGPFLLRVSEVTVTHSLAEERPDQYGLGIQLWWAPQVQVTSFTAPQLVEAKDPEGRAFRPSITRRGMTTHGVSTMRKHHDVVLSVVGAAGHQPVIGKLAVSSRIRFRHGHRVVRFDDVATLPQTRDAQGTLVDPVAAAASTKEARHGHVTLQALQKQGEAPRFQWVVHLRTRFARDLPRRSAWMRLTWSDGSVQRLHVMGGRSESADGSLELTARAYPKGDNQPTAVELIWYEKESEQEYHFTLPNVPLR
jgi:hypothetical protein